MECTWQVAHFFYADVFEARIDELLSHVLLTPSFGICRRKRRTHNGNLGHVDIAFVRFDRKTQIRTLSDFEINGAVNGRVPFFRHRQYVLAFGEIGIEIPRGAMVHRS